MSGSLTAIIGPMFSGKTTELMRLYARDIIAGKKAIVYKPRDDDRYYKDDVVTHAGGRTKAVAVYRPIEVWQHYQNEQPDSVYIDEAQFFDRGILVTILDILYEDTDVTFSSLNMDYQGNPFKFRNSTGKNIGDLLARADKITLLTAICEQCGNEATRTYRTSKDNDLHVIGGKDKYEARCASCYE